MKRGKMILWAAVIGYILGCLACSNGDAVKNPLWYEDQDNDGYTSGNVLQYSYRPEGYVSASELESDAIDCNDNNAYIHPGLIDWVDDGVDQDCTGYDLKTWYHDGDKDGYSEMAPGVQSETRPYPEDDDYFLKNALYAVGTDMDDNDPDITIEADECCPEGERIWRGDAYINSYPALKILEGCTEIEGRLTITGNGTFLSIEDPISSTIFPYIHGTLPSSDDKPTFVGYECISYTEDRNIIHLYPLRCLKKIGKDLLIEDAPHLKEIKGLINLTSVGGNLIISNNPMISNPEGLNNLDRIGGSLIVTDNHGLVNLSGLDHLAEIGGDLILWRNPALENIMGLNRLNHVAGGMAFFNNNMLTSVTGPNYAQIYLSGGLQVANHMRLNAIDPLGDLHVTGDVIVQNNSLLEETEVVDLLDQMKAHGRILGDVHVANNGTEGGVETTW